MRISLPSSISRAGFSIASFDLLWLAISPWFSLWLRGDNLLEPNNVLTFLSPIYQYTFLTIICGVPIFVFFRINNSLTHLCTSKDILTVFSAVSTSVLVSSYFSFSFSRLEGIPRSVPILYGVVLFLGLVGYRVVVRSLYEQRFVHEGYVFNNSFSENYKNIIIVGLNLFSISAIKLTDAQRPRTIRVIAAIDPRGRYAGKTISGVKIIGKVENFGKTLDEYNIHGVKVDEVWISDRNDSYDDYLSLLEISCRDREIGFKSIEDALNLNPVLIETCQSSHGFIKNNIFIKNASYLKIKRILDVVCASFLCIALFPIFIIVCSITLYTIGSPILFWQQRAGLYGRNILLYKVRTLGLPFHENGQILSDGDRLSKLGLIFRQLRLDEIPQLLSILVGDMSGIGPRPLLPRDQPKESWERLLVRPGLTGWAQVNGGELLSPEEKNSLDCWYVNHLSLILDVSIVFKTIYVLIHGVRRNETEINKALDWYRKRVS